MTRGPGRWIPVLALAMLQACATAERGAPFHSAWYFQPGGPEAAAAEEQVRIVIVNRSDRSALVTSVVLNRSTEEPLTQWTYRERFSLEPGGIVILPAAGFTRPVQARTGTVTGAIEFFSDKCAIPASVWVGVDLDTRSRLEKGLGWLLGDAPDLIRAELAGRIPSSLPEKWVRDCSPRESTPPR